MNNRTVFLVSDSTGITAETLGHSLLTQFEAENFKQVTLPFINTIEKADAAVARINKVAEEDGLRPIIFSTLVQDDIRDHLLPANGLFLDFFQTFLAPLEGELGVRSNHTAGRAHGLSDTVKYDQRIEATNYAMINDDGSHTRDYGQADVILIGVSRSGKTPTCLYLALTYGVFAANYPLSDEELETGKIPAVLEPHKHKLYGLTIAPLRLQQIRKERRPNGKYSTIQQVNYEIRAAEQLFKRFGINSLDTTHSSIEEIASNILESTGVERRVSP
jgi:regulator of PEP synthase PpsR (kinase-PPPase family)